MPKGKTETREAVQDERQTEARADEKETKAAEEAGEDAKAVQAPEAWTVKRKLLLTSPPMEGDDIRAVQEELIKRNYHCGIEGANGKYNKHTQYAVRCFQSWARLIVSGIVDRDTVEKMGGTWAG